ncbi:MAG: hypothetical protein Q7S00_00400, partial [bacterium]|nr:hypothetical protein [bacterium]
VVKNKSSLVRSGAEEYTVSATVQSQGKTLEVFQNSKERGPEIEGDKTALACLLDSSRFLSENPNTQKQLLFDLLGITVDEGNLKQHLQEWLKAHPDVLSKHWLPEADFEKLVNCLEKFPINLNAGYEEASDERKFVKRELKALEGINLKGIPKDLSPEMVFERMRQKQEELKELHTKIGEARGLVLGEEKSLEAEISSLSGQINMVETEIKSFNQGAEASELNRLVSEKETLDEELSCQEEEFHGIEVELAALQAVAKEKEAILTRLKKFTGLCPLFKEEYACKTEEVLAAIRERKEKTGVKEDGKILELQDRRKKVRELIEQKKRRHIVIEGGITSHRAGLARYEKNKKGLEELKIKREKLEAVVKTLDGRTTEELAALSERVSALESEIETDKGRYDLVSKASRKLALEEKLGKLEILATAFSPKGIMGDLLASATSRLRDETSRVMQCLSGDKYSVEIAPESFDIYLVDLREGRKTSVALSSESERFRLGVVFQAVLAQLSGLKFMVIDRLDMLDQQNRGFFFRFLQREGQNFDQILALCTIGQYQPKNP